MTEGDIKSAIRLATGQLRRVRLFNNPRGVGFMGKVKERTATHVVLLHPRQVEFGLADGASDLIGLTQVTITPEMVGRKLAVFTAAEVKKPGEPVPGHQQHFVEFVTGFGGIAGVVRSAEDALRLVGAA